MLSRAALSRLPPAVAVPSFDPAGVTAGIVHLGPGGFHRAHMARYTHDLMALRPEAREWGIVGVGLMPADAAPLAALAAQDNLYTLVERDEAREQATVIGAIAGVIDASHGSAPALAAIARPQTRIVSLTVTQAGYCIDNGTKRLDLAHPLIAQDLAAPESPRSAIGILVEGLAVRRAAAIPAFAALSCDNIQHNGRVLRRAVLDFAAARDAALAGWIGRHARFPSTMVDRITPVPTAEDRRGLIERFGIDDAVPVFCEPFRQWVIEDDFPLGRPDWDAVGAQFVADVTPHEFMKLRLLNATHVALSAPGQLMGHAHVHEAVADENLRRYAALLMDRETGPTVPPPPGIDLGAYKAEIVRRFANPTIRDTTERVNTDASLNYLLDPLRDRLARGEASPLLGFAVACWIRRAAGRDDAGAPLRVANATAAELGRFMASADPLAHLPTFGELADDPVFRNEVCGHLEALAGQGTAGALGALLDRAG